MFKRAFVLMVTLIFVLISFSGGMAEELSQEQQLKMLESYTDIIDVNGREGIIYYAQNSPEWDKLQYSEKSHKRKKTFGDAGCVATAISIAIANLIPMEGLTQIEDILRQPILIDTKSLTRDYGVKANNRFLIEKPEDYFRYFPLVIGNWSSGNNNCGIRDNASAANYKKLLSHFELDYTITRDIAVSLEAIDNGGFVVTSSGGSLSPISKFGHYFVIADYDDEYIYYIDPYIRSTPYPDQKEAIEKLSENVYRFKIEDLSYMRLNAQFAIYPSSNTPEYSKTYILNAIDLSDNYAFER